MARTIDVHEVEGRLSEFIDRAIGGEDILITRSGKAIAKIVPVRPTQSRSDNAGPPASLVEIAGELAALRAEIASRCGGSLDLATILNWRDSGRR